MLAGGGRVSRPGLARGPNNPPTRGSFINGLSQPPSPPSLSPNVPLGPGLHPHPPGGAGPSG